MKRTLSLFLALLLLLVTVPLGTFTASALSFGQTGGCYWTISGHTLTITGAGAMAGYDPGDAPWYESRSSITTVNITDDVTEIGDAAFYGCNALKDVSFGNNVTEIGDFAFGVCSALQSVTLPDSVIRIGKNAFDNCSELSSVTILSPVVTIGEDAFKNCDSYLTISAPCNAINVWTYCDSIGADKYPFHTFSHYDQTSSEYWKATCDHCGFQYGRDLPPFQPAGAQPVIGKNVALRMIYTADTFEGYDVSGFYVVATVKGVTYDDLPLVADENGYVVVLDSPIPSGLTSPLR